MTLASAAPFVMPFLLMVVVLVAGKRLEAFPGKEDLWQLPKPSSLR